MLVLATFIVLFVVGFLPLFGGAGYEAALVAGLVAPSLAALDVRRRVGQRLRFERGLGGGDLTHVVLGVGAAHGLAVLGVAALHTLRVGPCEPVAGFVELMLGPVAGVLLASALAAAATALTAAHGTVASWWGVLLVLGVGPLGSALVSGLYFYGTPAVYAFDPFVGYFRGPLYDVVEFEPERLLVYRVGTACSVGALLSLLRSARLTAPLGERPRLGWRSGPGWLFVVLFGLASGAHQLAAERLGFLSTEARLERELPGRAASGACTVRYGLGVPSAVATRMARECSGHVLALRGRLGLGESWPVRVLLFSGAQEKAAFMGARTTYIAKPWRREVYLQIGEYPHPVLGHELAHVVLGELGQGPFRIAGHAGGLLPDPGRIEGFAVFVAPREGAEGTTRQWAAALARVLEMPPIESVFSVEFLGASAARSYTVAGAFVEYVFERHGAAVGRRWYAGEELPTLSGQSWKSLDAGFRSWLEQTDVPRGVLSLAELRFAAPGLFGRRCPHAADRALGLAELACNTAPERVAEFVELAIEFDSSKAESRALVPTCLAPAGTLSEAERQARALLAQPGALGDPSARELLELLGDVAFARGELRPAADEYDRASRIAVGAAQERALTLKIWALSADPVARDAIYRLLVRAPLPTELLPKGLPSTGPSQGEAGDAGDAGFRTSAGFERARSALEAWRSREGADGTPAYLLALGAMSQDPRSSIALFDEALDRGLLTPELEVEARARSVLLLSMTGQLVEAEQRLDRLRALGAEVPGAGLRAEQLGALIERERLAARAVSESGARAPRGGESGR